MPKYVFNCFLRAGYDNVSAITQMVTDEGPDNSLDQIEAFIVKYYSTDNSCYPSTITENKNSSNIAQKFVFPPGHRILITTFVKGIKADCNKKHIKRSSGDQLNPAKRKKVVSIASFTADRQPKVEKNCYDLESISNDIRKRIVKWQRRQNDDAVTKLREHTHYKVNCTLDSSGCLDVHVSCEICNKKYKLHHKHCCGSSVIMISNWTGHIKNVSKTERYPKSKQAKANKPQCLNLYRSYQQVLTAQVALQMIIPNEVLQRLQRSIAKSRLAIVA